jgi:UDP-N-acetylglucosamine:LPS N-acetylglucosamine transferase
MAVENNIYVTDTTFDKSTAKKKKILVLISDGGGGHKAAGESLKEILGSSYDVQVINPLAAMLRSIDGLSTLTYGRFTGEDLYNFMLRKGQHRFIKLFFCHLGTFYMRSKIKRVRKLFDRYLRESGENRPALIISTFPMINAALFDSSQNAGVPFLILPTDLDCETFLLGMDELKIDEGAKLAVALPYDDPDLQQKAVREGRLKNKHLHVTGFPVRPACQKKYTPEELKELRSKHGLKEGLPTLTIIMGAEGGDTILHYAQELCKLQFSSSLEAGYQVNVCVGRNRKIAAKIGDWALENGGEKIAECEAYTTVLTKDKVYLHLRTFTQEVVEIMACSDLIITKTGSCSINEAIYLGKRLLLDNTENSSARHIWWESFNVAFVKKHNLGDAFCDLSELKTKAVALLSQTTQSPSARGDFRLPAFAENVLKLVKSMIE